MDPRLLDILCCPLTHVPLRLLTADELGSLGRAVAGGGVTTSAGRVVTEPPDAALITTNAHTIYRIDDDIPVMLAEEAIPVAGIADFPH
jgi:uncharacterized protein YbaR (Trm112 family)